MRDALRESRRREKEESERSLVNANLVRDLIDFSFLPCVFPVAIEIVIMTLGFFFVFLLCLLAIYDFLFDILGSQILVRGDECEAGFFAIMNKTFSVMRTSLI